MNDIVRPLTDDQMVGFDQFDQLWCWRRTKDGRGKTGTIIVDVREMICRICNYGWETNAESLSDQIHWSLVEEWVHETCLVRHISLNERAEFRNALFSARTGLFETGIRLPFRMKEIPNRYWPESDAYSKKPWYEFTVLDRPYRFILGSRKRVAVVQVEPTEGVLVSLWLEAAKDTFAAEDVTKTFNPEYALIHAWSEEKVKEYVAKFAQLIYRLT